MDEKFSHSVKLGNDTRIIVCGKRDIKLEVHGRTHVMSDVFYVLELHSNLLCVG